jgi:hypothetical protein
MQLPTLHLLAFFTILICTFASPIVVSTTFNSNASREVKYLMGLAGA